MKNSSFLSVLRRFMSLNRDYMPSFYLAMVFLMLNQILTAFISFLMGRLTDFITRMQFEMFGYGILLLIFVQCIHLVTEYQVNYRVNYLSESFVKRLRSHTYNQITKASMRWLDENKLGDIISRINGDLNTLVSSVNTFMTWQITGAVTFIVYMAACFVVNVKLSLISFALVPVIACLQFITGKPIARLGEERSAAEGRANSVFVDLTGGLSMIKVFGTEAMMSRKYNKQVDETVRANVKSFALEFVMYPLQVLMQYIPVLIIVLFGSSFVIKGEMTIGSFFSYILLSTGALNAIGSLSWQVRNIYNTIGIANRIFAIWDVEPEDEGGNISKKQNNVPVVFKNVVFSYKEDQNVLNNVSFEVKEGEKIALVGASGSGKSTIMKLLSGFYEKNSGEILMYGSSLEEWNKEKLREYMTYVGQESFLFPGSIYSNVSLGNKEASRQEISDVIEAVGLGGLDIDAPIGERGVMLSGGQRQRICIARALLKRADLILMDEPTSALDTESEYYVEKAVEKYAADKTCITIAHRLSTIKNVDRIICLKDGRIAESGTHDELMKINGVYKHLYQKQNKDSYMEAK